MTELRTRPGRELPDLEAEQEVDVRRAWDRIAARWWLALLGLVLGAIVGYALALGGGGKTYSAKALIYLGSPTAAGGSTPLPGLTGNPRYVREVVTSEAAVRHAAQAAGLRPGQVRGHIATGTASGATALGASGSKTPQTLVTITATGHRAGKTAIAANALASYVVGQLASFPRTKIRSFDRLLASYSVELTSLKRRIAALNSAIRSPRLDPVQKLVLVSQLDSAEQRRGDVITQQADTEQQLTQARDVESPRIISRAFARETTARSRRNSLLVGAILGLLLGTIAALTWDGLAARFGRRPAL